jgi:hypothetical protein
MEDLPKNNGVAIDPYEFFESLRDDGEDEYVRADGDYSKDLCNKCSGWLKDSPVRKDHDPKTWCFCRNTPYGITGDGIDHDPVDPDEEEL